jgi:hypothetical protein
VDEVVGSLGNEISALKDVLNNAEKLATAASTESLNGPEHQHWENVEWTLVECEGTLEKLHSTLDKALNTTRRSIFRPWRQMKLDWNMDEISQLRGDITSWRHRIDIYLKMLPSYKPN